MVVTTRSTERRLQARGPTEDLALRTKHGEVSPSPNPSVIPASTLQSSVFVKIPPFRKGGSASRTVASSDTNTTSSQIFSDAAGPFSHSQASDAGQLVPGIGAGEYSDRLSDADAPTKEPLIPPKPDIVTAAHNEQNEIVPQRFPSQIENEARASLAEERQRHDNEVSTSKTRPAGDDQTGSGSSFDVADTASNEDDSEAPEVTSSNTRKATTSTRAKRRAHMPQIATPKSAIASIPASKYTTPSFVKLDTMQTNDLGAESGSKDSNDSAFVTARTHRHKDMLATPSDVASDNIDSPTVEHHVKEEHHRPSQSEELVNTKRRGRNLESIPSSVDSAATALPRKAGNTLENYRRQLLLNRADKSRKRENGRFELEADWAHKRRKFLVSY